MPSRTTPVIPGRRTSVGSTTRSQIEVPTTITNVPGESTPAPGTDTKESTFPTATATGVAQAEALGELRPQAFRRCVPSGANSLPSFAAGLVEPGVGGLEVRRPAAGLPPGDHIAL